MRWYRAWGRHELPWRLTRDPYAVLVSEVMLQQTQVERVLPYYTAWLERWPTIASLSKAATADVIRAWGGLGYNRRAVNLQRAAAAIEAAGEGFPREVSALVALPGVGPYTGSAIASFAFEQRAAVADTNIARVLARLVLGVATQRAVPPAEVTATAERLLPTRDVRDHNLALMDLGALVCTARRPACEACAVRSACAWRAGGYPAATVAEKPSPRFEETARFARGRIVDALRGSESLSTWELRELLPAEHHARLDGYLVSLRREGMVNQAADGRWQLPAATGG